MLIKNFEYKPSYNMMSCKELGDRGLSLEFLLIYGEK